MEDEQEPWEALDHDDSDLPSLLCPCNARLHHQTPSAKSPNPTSTSSQRHHPFIHRCSQTPISQSQHSNSPSPLPNSPRLFPGPAGAVQAAMHRRTHHNQALLHPEEEPVPTQEYIRRVVENGDHADADNDFVRDPWLCALDFLHREGTVGAPLSSIKNGLNAERVAQVLLTVVAIIKSCTPNGHGDMMVTLKDPTSTIGASIHRKVLTEGEFGKDISVGAVLVLQKVAVFSPSRSAHYLNVTLSNLVKVISKDSGPPLKQQYPASATKHSAPVSESSEKSWMPQGTPSLLQERSEGIINSLRQTCKLRGSAPNDKGMDKGKGATQSGCFGSGMSRTQNVVAEKESLLMRLGVGNRITEVASKEDTICIDQEIVMSEEPNPCKETEGGNPSCNAQGSSDTANFVDVPNDQEGGRANEVNKKRHPVISRASLPQWTDEQLDVLMAFD